jgi:Stress responsive A/B Barrel Domain
MPGNFYAIYLPQILIWMKKILLLSAIAIISFNTVEAQKNKNHKVLRHVVMFGWQAGTDSADIRKIVDALRQLPSKIGLIKAFEWGTNSSPENLNQELTHCFFLTFYSEKDRNDYLVHPAHKAFVALLNPAPAKVTVFDYWTQQ